MNSKQLMFEALWLRRPPVVPFAPVYPSLYLDSTTHRHYLEQYKRSMKPKSTIDIDHREDTKRRAEALYHGYGIFEHRCDWIEVYCGFSKQWASETAVEWPDFESEPVFVNKKTGKRVASDPEIFSYAASSYLGKGLSENQDNWDCSMDFTSRSHVDEAIEIVKAEDLLGRGVLDFPKKVLDDYGERFFISTIVPTPLWSAYYLLGFQGMMTMMYDRPTLLHYLLERRLEQFMEIAKGFAAIGVHGIFVEECLTSADLVSPRHFDEFSFPYIKEMVKQVHQLGPVPILYYTGHVLPRLPRLKESGAAALAVEESKKDFVIEIGEVVKAVGDRMCVFGNIDAIGVGLQGTEGSIEREVARQLAAGAGAASFVMSTGSPFPRETNPRNVDDIAAATNRMSARHH